MAAKYRPVLSAPGCIRLLLTSLVARLPQGMSSLAVLLLVRGATHSYAAAGVAVGAGAFGAASCGPLLGRLIDRLGARRVIAPAALLQTGIYVLIVVAADAHAPAILLILCSMAAGSLVPPVAPVVRTMFTDMFEDAPVREVALGLEAIAQETIWIVGPLLVTIVIAAASAKVAVLLMGAAGLLGSVAFLASPLVGAAHHHRHSGAAARVRALASLDLRWMLPPVALMGVMLGAVEVGIPALALHQGSRSDSGLLLALWSFGSMIGGVSYSVLHLRSPLGTRYLMLLLALAASLVPMIFAGSIPVAAVCSLIGGLTIAPLFTCQNSLVGHILLPGSEHEAFSWVLSALIAGAAAGSALGGVTISALGIRAPFVLACLVSLLGALTAVRFHGRFAPQRRESPPPAVLAEVP